MSILGVPVVPVEKGMRTGTHTKITKFRRKEGGLKRNAEWESEQKETEVTKVGEKEYLFARRGAEALRFGKRRPDKEGHLTPALSSGGGEGELRDGKLEMITVG